VSIWADEQGRIHVGIQVNGRRIHRRLPEGATKGAAKQLEADLRRSAGKRTPNIPGDPPLTAAMELYLAHAEHLRSPETARFHALRAGQWLLDRRASEAEEAVAAMVKDMRGHYAPATINKSIGAIKTALALAHAAKLTPANYGAGIRRLPENNQRHEYLSIAQVGEIADNASEQVRAAIWIALLTGCRRGEILKLDKADIRGDALRIQAGNTKTLRERTVPIVPALRPWLAHIPLQINFEGLKTGFRRAREKVGMPQIHFHDLRHSTASLLINMGTPLEVVRDILGHTTVKTTERYAHLLIDKQRDALDMLSAAVNAK
jgi:integrase